MHINRRQFVELAATGLLAGCGYGKSNRGSRATKELMEQFQKTSSFRYPLDENFPEIPVTVADPPGGARYHAGEDSYAPPGTPVYAIWHGIIRYSGEMGGYG